MITDWCESEFEPKIAILTDLDGTLLDHETYSLEPARRALERAKARGWPVIFCSSKTRLEIEAIRSLTGIEDPFISENGGAIFMPKNYLDQAPAAAITKNGYRVVEIGWPHGLIVRRMRRVREEQQLPIRGFSDMASEEIARLCGLEPAAASRAASREYDEPFEILSTDPQVERQVVRKLERSGLFVVKGGRFHHLIGPSDKGRAAAIILDLLQDRHAHLHSLAMGDAMNDLPLLQIAELCAIIKRDDHEETRVMQKALPHALLPSRPGPEGWSDVVGDLLDDPSRACVRVESFLTL